MQLSASDFYTLYSPHRMWLTRFSHTVRSEGQREAREFKARAGSSPEAYLTVRRGLEPSATQKARASRKPQPEECEKCGLRSFH